MTTEAFDGTFDTTDTGGGSTPSASAPPIVLEEGRAFRSDAETRALVNAAYGVEDADPYDNPNPEAQIGAPVVEDDVEESAPAEDPEPTLDEGEQEPQEPAEGEDEGEQAAEGQDDAEEPEEAAEEPVAEEPVVEEKPKRSRAKKA